MPIQSHHPPTSNSTATSASASGAPAFDQAYGNAAAQEALGLGQPQDGCIAGELAPDAELGAARVGAPTSKRAALARHQRNRDKVDRIVRSAAASVVDPTAGADSRVNLLRNTAEWILAGEADLYVVTPTHDAHLRPSVAPGQNAYFDLRTKYDEAGADYDDTLDASGQATNDAGIEIAFGTVAGSMGLDGRTMLLMDPLSHSEGDIVTFFIPEVQHDADQHRPGEAWEVDQPPVAPGMTKRAPQWAYNSYQSEFRAYWMMNPEGSSADWFGSSADLAVTNIPITAVDVGIDLTLGGSDDTSVTATTAFSNVRQEDIFNHMYGGGQANSVYWDATGWTQSYAYLPHYYALDPAFRAMVDAYDQPASGNLINSPRIQALSTAISGGGDWQAALDALDTLDVNYLADQDQARPFWDQAAAALPIVDHMLVEATILGGVSYGPFDTTVTVVEGDTLSAIADRYLDDKARWREIYDINRDVIGRDPNRLVPGQQLHMPAL